MRVAAVVVASVEIPVTTFVLVVVLLVVRRLETTAFVVVEFPTIKLVMEARVATRDEKKPLVVDELVIVALVAARFVEVLLIALKLVVKKFVEVELAIREEDAKIFCTKRLRNLLSDEPRE